MIYTKEVELMCPVAKGAKHEPAPIPEEGKWVQCKENRRYFRFHTWCGLVCSAAGCLQADPEC